VGVWKRVKISSNSASPITGPCSGAGGASGAGASTVARSTTAGRAGACAIVFDDERLPPPAARRVALAPDALARLARGGSALELYKRSGNSIGYTTGPHGGVSPTYRDPALLLPCRGRTAWRAPGVRGSRRDDGAAAGSGTSGCLPKYTKRLCDEMTALPRWIAG